MTLDLQGHLPLESQDEEVDPCVWHPHARQWKWLKIKVDEMTSKNEIKILHVQSGNPKYPDLQTVHLSSMIFALQEHTPLSLQVVEVAPA